MKILIANDGPTAFYYIRLGLARAFQACGHTVKLWDIHAEPVFDVFDTFEPDLFLGQTYNTTKSLCQTISERPHIKVIMKASDWGKLTDKVQYPILKANPQETKTILTLHEETGKPDFVHIHYHSDYVEGTHGYWMEHGIPAIGILNGADIFDYTNGKYKKELDSDICFIGGYWGYKAQTFDHWLLPICAEWKYRIKIFGNGAWPIPQYCGFIANDAVKDALFSAKICLNLSEPHSQVFGFDIIERPFKLLSNKCFMISDYVEGLNMAFGDKIVMAKTPEEFREKVDYFINNPDERQQYINAGYDEVMGKHTYFHRAAQIFEELKLSQHAQHCLSVYNNIRNNI